MSEYSIPIREEKDIYLAISCARVILKQLQFSKAGEQKVLVSISELTRNVLDHANRDGVFFCKALSNGIEFVVQDNGPGIENINYIFQQEKVESKTGLGLGLLGVKRLVDEFHIESTKRGTKAVVVKWKE